MKKKLLLCFIILLFVFTVSCKDNSNTETPNDNNNSTNDSNDNNSNDNNETNNNTGNESSNNSNNTPGTTDDNIIGVTTGGTYGTLEPNATTFTFNATRLTVPTDDYEYLNIGTYGTNNFFQFGGDIRIRINDNGTKVKGIELEKNTLGWVKFTINDESIVSFNVASTSSENTSKVVLINADTKQKQILSSSYTDVNFNFDNTIASVTGTSYCKITSNLTKGTYILRSPAITDKNDVSYRKNLMLLNIAVGDDIQEEINYFLTADTLQTGTYSQNIRLFYGDWGSINLTATTEKYVMIDTNNKTYDEHSFGTRIKTCGKMESGNRALIIKLNKKYEITMYAMSSSKSEARIVNIYDSELSNIIYTFDNVLGTELYTYSYTLDAGTYYLTTTTGGLNIYAFNLAQK